MNYPVDSESCILSRSNQTSYTNHYFDQINLQKTKLQHYQHITHSLVITILFLKKKNSWMINFLKSHFLILEKQIGRQKYVIKIKLKKNLFKNY